MWISEIEVTELFKEFKISIKQINTILESEMIKFQDNLGERRYCYVEINKLIDKINHLYTYNKNNMYTSKQLIDLGLNKKQKINRKELLLIEKIKEFRYSSFLYPKDDILLLQKEIANKKNVLSAYGASKILGIKTYNKLYSILEYYNIVQNTGADGRKYYNKHEIEKVKEKLDELYEENRKNYYTSNELINMGFERFDLEKFPREEIILVEKINAFEQSQYKYLKDFILEIYNQTQNQNQIDTYTSLEVSTILSIPNNHVLFEYLKTNNIVPIKKRRSQSYHWKKKDIEDLINQKEDLDGTFFENYVGKNRFSKFLNISWKEIVDCTKLEISFDIFPRVLRISHFKNEEFCLNKKELESIIEKLTELSSSLNMVTEEKLKKLNKFKSDISWGIFKCNENRYMERLKKERIADEKIKDIFGYVGSIDDFHKLLKNYNNIEVGHGIRKILTTRNEILDKYDIHIHTFNKIELSQKFPIAVFSNTSFYPLNVITEFFEKLIRKQDKLLANYYSRDQLEGLGLTDRYILKLKNAIEVPEALRFGRIKKSKLYQKLEVEKIHLQMVKRDIHLKHKKKLEFTTLPGQVFMDIITDIKECDSSYYFSEKARLTESKWLEYAQRQINKSEGNSETIYTLILCFLELNELLIKTITEKEIINMSTNEINLKIFNSDISPYSLQQLNKFLRNLEEKFETRYQSENFVNLFKLIEQNKKSLTKKFYSVDEYLKLVDYVSKIETHKNNVIKEFNTIANYTNVIKYREYESVWLYVILHLNNAWRNKDFIYKIPRINLPDGINSIDDFRNYELSMSAADKIVSELSAKIIGTKHNKNNKEAYFFCSEDMKLPLANALILCELKCRLYRPLNNHLIKLTDDDKLNTTLNNKFFKDFEIEGFVFSSLAANRSFITIINLVLKKSTNRNPLELTKYIRNHHSINMTNTYMQISEEQLNLVSKTIFNTGYFGYTYELLLKSVLEINSTSQLKLYQPTDYEFIKHVFGDIVQIENTSIYMNYLNNYNSVYEFINDLKDPQKIELLNYISLEQLPAKEQYWQCILGNCIYINRNCSSCPFAIPHMFTLTTVLANLEKYLKEYEADLNEFVGEKRRLANLIYKNLLLLSSAKKKFGESVLDSFLGYKYSKLKIRIGKLQNFDNYLTVKGV